LIFANVKNKTFFFVILWNKNFQTRADCASINFILYDATCQSRREDSRYFLHFTWSTDFSREESRISKKSR